MATDGHIESVHQVADGEVDAPLDDGTSFIIIDLTIGHVPYLSIAVLVRDCVYPLFYDRRGQ